MRHVLYARMALNPPFQDPAPIEFEETRNQHLRRRVESLVERSGPADALGDLAEPVEHARIGEKLTIGVVLLVPQLQQVGDSVAERSDPELERAAVADERADVQADQVVRGVYAGIGRAEKGKVVLRLIDDGVEVVGRDGGVSVHEGEVAIDLGQKGNLFSPALCLTHPRRQVDCEVGIAAQTEDDVAFVLRLRHELGENIDPRVQQVAHDMGVVAAHVVLLGEGTVEKASWLEIELRDADVVGQIPTPEWVHVREFRVAAKQSIGQRLHEAPFEFALPPGPRERQRREDPQLEARVLPRPPEELVDEVVRFPKPQRGAEANLPPDPADSGLDARFHVGKLDGPVGHRAASLRLLARS